MSEVLLCSCRKDGLGLMVLDIHSGASIAPAFKHCICDEKGICLLGKSQSSFEGSGCSGDYIAAATSQKTSINIWQWSKPQVHIQCHTQEIITVLSSNQTGSYVFGGTKRGFIYLWDVSSGELLKSWHAHFKSVTQIVVDHSDRFCISASEDGMVRVWDICDLVDSFAQSRAKKNIVPFRSYTPHNLAVKDIRIIGSMASPRIVSASLDRSIVVYDIFDSKQVLRIPFKVALESLAVHPNEDILAAGASNGSIFLIDFSLAATAISNSYLNSSSKWDSSQKSESERPGISECVGHNKAVKTLEFSKENLGLLVSGSDDGSLRWWNIWTRQCTVENRPFHGVAITNLMIVERPELLLSSHHKPFLHPIQALKKYSEIELNNDSRSKAANIRTVLSPALLSSCCSSLSCNEKMSLIEKDFLDFEQQEVFEDDIVKGYVADRSSCNDEDNHDDIDSGDCDEDDEEDDEEDATSEINNRKKRMGSYVNLSDESDGILQFNVPGNVSKKRYVESGDIKSISKKEEKRRRYMKLHHKKKQ